MPILTHGKSTNVSQKGRTMGVSRPIKEMEQIKNLEQYFLRKGQYRNYCLVVLGLNTALRISDLLDLKWSDVRNADNNKFYSHILITEQKTKKHTQIYLNIPVVKALRKYWENEKETRNHSYIFFSPRKPDSPISRIQAYRIIKAAAEQLALPEQISCHSLRKTFGYQAWKTGAEPALLMHIYNHSSYQITKRYLGIDQDDKDKLFMKLEL